MYIFGRTEAPQDEVHFKSITSSKVLPVTVEVALPFPTDPWVRNFLISFKERDRPVPSYPLIVEAIKIRYGPNSDSTIGKGNAAASSITRSSAWPNF